MTGPFNSTTFTHAGDVATLCLCWKLRRRDGVILTLTEHDQDLILDGAVYHAADALSAGSFAQNSGLSPGRGAAGGVLSAEAITQRDLQNGLWDRCRIDIYRVDWADPHLPRIAIWQGYLSEVTVKANGAYEAELVSLKADLERPIGRIYARRCDAALGDSRCGIEARGRHCDKRIETCRYVFDNVVNFRGFPHLPGNDFILSGPADSGNDGGKR